MKILLLVPALNSGGVETGTIDLSKSLKDASQDVIVVSSGGKLLSQLERYNVKHIPLPIHKKSLFTFLQIPSLIKIIQDENIDIVHAQSRVPAWVAYFACKKTHTPFVTSCHGYYSKNFFSSVMGRGRKVMVISRLIAEHMKNTFGVRDENIRLVYRGVDLSQYPYQPEKYSQPKDKFTIVNIARITPIKGQMEFIRAIDIVRKQIPNIEVWLVGSADKKEYYKIRIQNLVKELNLTDKVKFLGRRSDVAEILKDSDLLVLSTKIPEAFGRVIIEAGAIGTAVCAPRIGAVTEIIEDKKDGILFTPPPVTPRAFPPWAQERGAGFTCQDENSMAQAILTMLKDSNLMKYCSRNLRKKVEDNFTLSRMVEQTLEVYKEAISEKKILVIKLGGLGDLILAIPSLRALRNKFPKSRISLLLNSNFEPLIKNCPYLDQIILFDRKKTKFLEILKSLKKREFDLSIDLKNNNLTYLLAFFAKIPSRYGFAKGFLSFLLNYSEKLSLNLSEGSVEEQARILKNLGILTFQDKLELWTDNKDDIFIETALREKGVTPEDRLVGMAVEASSKWPTKNWPIENFSQLSERLIQRGLKVVLLGEESLRAKIDKFPKDKRIVSFIGETDLNQLVSLIKRLDVLITPDSAPMHIAAALGNKIIALFGPTEPKRHAPPTKNIKVIVKQIECQPCYKRSCVNKQKLACLKNISVDEIDNLVRSVM